MAWPKYLASADTAEDSSQLMEDMSWLGSWPTILPAASASDAAAFITVSSSAVEVAGARMTLQYWIANTSKCTQPVEDPYLQVNALNTPAESVKVPPHAPSSWLVPNSLNRCHYRSTD